MKESLLHMVWRFQLFDSDGLVDHEGRKVQVIHQGQWNHNEGPDFLQAHLKIGPTEWHGHVEIHVKASEWKQHKHSSNKHYNNVIAHVVLEEDELIQYPGSDQTIPTIVLSGRIPPYILRNYKQLEENLNWIPCSGLLPQVYTDLRWQTWSERLIIERLESKQARIKSILQSSNQDWSQSFFIWLAYGFGLKVNAEAMMTLANRISVVQLQKYHYSRDMIEAMFFGLAGFLTGSFRDAYPLLLQEHFNFLRNKYQWSHVAPIPWKFHRMRPVAFPTSRISQLADVLHNTPHLLSRVLEITHVKDLEDLLQCEANEYWKTHSKWEQEIKPKSVKAGHDFIRRLLINVIIPLVYCYGDFMDQHEYKIRAVNWLLELPAENNKIVRSFKTEGISAENAADTQALYALKKHYCEEHRCLECSFGYALINSTS